MERQKSRENSFERTSDHRKDPYRYKGSRNSYSRGKSATRLHPDPYYAKTQIINHDFTLPQKKHDPDSARRPINRRGPSPLKKSFSSSQWEPQRGNEDTFGYKRRNTSRSDSKRGIVNVQTVRTRSPDFYHDESEQNDSAYYQRPI